MIKEGNLVSVHYTGKLENGTIFDSSTGREALSFKVGSGQIIKGFEDAVIGKEVGDKVEVTISSENAYGDAREDLIINVTRDQMPGEVSIGQSLEASTDEGQVINVIVTEIDGDNITIDGNHPLAGLDLTFDIEVMEIK